MPAFRPLVLLIALMLCWPLAARAQEGAPVAMVGPGLPGAIAREVTEALPRYTLDISRTFDGFKVFGRRAPVVLEIGFGMGETTAAIAASKPDVDFVGVEMHLPGVGALLRRIEAQRLTNLRVVRADAVEVIDPTAAASVGVATLPNAAATADELVQAADAAMYQVKDRGKNGVHAARTR